MMQRPSPMEVRCAAERVNQYREIFRSNGVTHNEAEQILTEDDLACYVRCVQILRANQVYKTMTHSK